MKPSWLFVLVSIAAVGGRKKIDGDDRDFHGCSTHQIHGIFVRESFSDSERAVAFFERFLPETIIHHLNLETLTVLKETYINEALKEHFSDLVFEVSLKADNSVKTDVVLQRTSESLS